MAKARATLVPWIRRQLAREAPIVVRLRLFHVPDSHGRGSGAHVDDVRVPTPRPESLTAETLADDLIDIARSHASTYGGRQGYRVSAYDDDKGDEPIASWPFAVTVESEDTAIDASSEPHDSRSFGAMAARHSEALHRATLASVNTLLSTMGDIVDRLDRRLVASEERVDRYQAQLVSVSDARVELDEERRRMQREKEESAEDSEVKAELLGLVQQAMPALMPMLMAGAQRLIAPKKKRRRKPTKKTKPRAKKPKMEVVS